MSAHELLELILDEFELKPTGRSKGSYLDTLNQFLINKHAMGQRVLVILDEAQNLSQEALEEVRMLSNLQTDKASLLQILLSGQPGLRRRLQHPSLSQLSQRIAVSYHLGPLGLEDTRSYISYRVKIAGGKREGLFSPGAMEKVFQCSGGVPRTINILCDAALVYGYADELTTIGEQVIEGVIQDRQETGIVVASYAEENDRLSESDDRQDGSLEKRIESLEQQVSHLSAIVDWQVRNLEGQAQDYKDTLVQRLEAMLSQERKRADKLLVQYNLLKDRPKTRKVMTKDEQKESHQVKSPDIAAARPTWPANIEDNRKAGWTEGIRRWFSRKP
ncbi:MAG: hypothetical protein BBJ60_07935 [Desulfobacterales bacterium S7086C20]|nr:MAG: hypothetical protein BBJ60_07935 [Desulfobacterales bacterium S7086C20]